ncbi:MAG TPA: helix-hairpin-helix domain-containing protein [Flavitalea sp.]|nr:helix-hairpin-helix domain-containing protein [Flavitalea sp.]
MKAKEYFAFTKRERSGIISLIILVLVVVVIPKYFNRPPQAASSVPIMAFHDSASYNNDTEKNKQEWVQKKNTPRSKFYRKNEPFEINKADTNAFIALPGIGSKLAARIVLFREKLGGFYKIEQIREVYGIQDSVYTMIAPMLRCNPGNIKKIDINTAEKETLKGHPYIRWDMANALVAYRSQHGSFNSIGDLSRLDNIDENALKKLIPYISFK